MFNFLKNLSPIELGVIALIFILLFGTVVAKKLAKTSGETVKEIKKVKKVFTDAVEDEGETPKNS